MRIFHIEWVSHSNLSDNKSPQVSSTLLSILSALNNANYVWMVSTHLVISRSLSPCINPLVTVPRAPITIDIVTLMFHSFFNSIARSRYLSFFPHSFSFTLWSARTVKSWLTTAASSLFFIDYNKIWSSGWDLVIRLFLQIPEEFVCLIFQDRFWVVHIPFVRMVKHQLLANLPVDHLAHPVVPSLIFFLC